MTECHSELPYNFSTPRPLVVRFSDLELSSDAGILLARQAEEQVQVCRNLSECIEDWRDPNKITHSLHQLVSQRVYQLVGGYEDANDSNVLRHDPIFKLACGRSPGAGTDLLASQPTITRLENHIGKAEVSAMRSRMVNGFIKGYTSAPEEIVLDIDGWDDPTTQLMAINN
jgi:Transposase DDE domain group 1